MSKVLIIAEAGVNHNGDINIAKKLIDCATAAKVDAVKFQTFKAEKLSTSKAKLTEYQKSNTRGDSQFEMLKKLELSLDDHHYLKEYSENNGLIFLSSAFDEDGLDFLNSLEMPFFKIPSGEITNKPYLEKVATFNKPIILSTGMSTIREIDDAVNILNKKVSLDNITLLHCNSEYPTIMKDVNLLAMKHLEEVFGTAVGYSDHTLGIEVPTAAVALGATVIEKHFTIDRALPGPDHKASLTPEELILMVSAIRNIEKAIAGSGLKEVTSSELKNKDHVRKGVYFKRDLESNTIIDIKDLCFLRPYNGCSPMLLEKIVGAKIIKGVKAGDSVSIKNLLR